MQMERVNESSFLNLLLVFCACESDAGDGCVFHPALASSPAGHIVIDRYHDDEG